ncbi:flagellar assembly protein FliH [Aliarcobacter cryaerophilus]|uniref:FliH/SctL family protein n=1 Tax=Aliarcobacter cryaerophilus TaxID=28198 RepID=UPI0021B5CC0D|nr:flagellar assembly protein FliH [Aliarcobacter cryaerophilus]MCT7529197.1 flagellar assembly protein FliH [Aliarcobacter cryaerophilus]
MAENVYSSARILKDDKKVEKFELSNFLKNKLTPKEGSNEFLELKLEEDGNSNLEKTEVKPSVQSMNIVDNSAVLEKIEPIFAEFEKMIKKIEEVSQKVTTIEQDAIIKGKEFDTQVIKAIKDLKQCATFFEQAAFGFESKLLKTSISIAQKIINIEVGENSSKIAKQTINQLLLKLKNATKVKIHLNPKDYYILKQELELEPFIELLEDPNVVAGGVVIASNIGNFDGSIEAKVSSMLESLDLVI